jgi:WD40 repeat protein
MFFSFLASSDPVVRGRLLDSLGTEEDANDRSWSQVPRVNGFRRSIAVLIGIDEYSPDIPRLRTPVSDANKIAQKLHDDHYFEDRVLINQQATLSCLRKLLEGMKKEVGPDDRVFFYFAGHGIALDGQDGPQGYVLPQDASSRDSDRYLPMTELSAGLSALTCRHMLVVLDCCFAGTLRWSSTRHLFMVPEVLSQERYAWFVQDPAWQAIASAAHDQKALDVAIGEPIGARERPGNVQHSPFAQALLDGLSGAADRRPADGTEGDNIITATELYLYLRERVEPPPGSLRPLQTPILWPLPKHDKGEFVFLVPGKSENVRPAPLLTLTANPWRGLESYEIGDSDLFFGRERHTEQLTDHIAESALTVVTGQSGIGKSSLVKAGLLGRLLLQNKEQAEKEKAQWLVIGPFRPGVFPFESLADALRSAGHEGEQGAVSPAPSASTLQSDPSALSSWVRKQTGASNVILVVDQLEELVTISSHTGDAHDFCALLEATIAGAGPNFRIVVTLRSDFEPQFSNSALKARWQSAKYSVPPMTQDELRHVIVQPAMSKVIRFQSDALIDQLINDVVNTPGALPLLSFALSEMYIHYLGRRASDRMIALFDYDSLQGGASGALRSRADRELDALDDQQRTTARTILERLVSIQMGEWARRRVSGSEFVFEEDEENRRVKHVLDAFIRARLIVAGGPEESRLVEDEANSNEVNRQFELAHDILIFGWDRLRLWLRDDYQNLLTHRRLMLDANAWDQSGRVRPDLLWDDPARLAGVNVLLSHFRHGLNEVELKFALASRKRAKRNRFVRRAVTVTLVSISVGLLALATIAFRNAREATGRQFAAQSDLILRDDDTQLDMAGWLAANAIARVPSPQSQTVARKVLALLPMPLTRFKLASEPDFRHASLLAVSADSTRLALVIANDKAIHIYDFRSGQKIWEFLLPAHAMKDVFTADGRLLALGLQDGSVMLYDTVAKTQRCLTQHRDKVNALRFSEDGSLLITGSTDGESRLIDVHTFKVTPIQRGGEIMEIAISPERTQIAMGGTDGIVQVLALPSQAKLLQRDFGSPIHTLEFSPDGRWLGVGTLSTGATVVSTAEGVNEVPVSINRKLGTTNEIAFSPIKPTVDVAIEGAGYLDYLPLNAIAPPNWSKNINLIHSIGFSDSGQYVVSASQSTARVYEEDTGREVARITHPSWVILAKFTSTGDVASISDDGTIRLSRLHTITSASRLYLTSQLLVGAVSPSGRYLATAGPGGVNIIDRATTSERTVVIIGDDPQLSFSRKDQYLLVGSANRTESVHEVGSGKVVWSKELKSKVDAVAFSPDGKLAVSGTDEDGKVSVRLATTGDEVSSLSTDCVISDDCGITAVAVSPQYEVAVAAGYRRSQPGFVSILDIKGRKLPTRLDAVFDTTISFLQYSPNGRHLAVGGYNGKLHLFDATTHKEKWSVSNPSFTRLLSIAFSPDGRTIISGDESGVVRGIEAATGNEMWRSDEGGPVLDVQFADDGPTYVILSGFQNSRVRQDLVCCNDLIRELCSRITPEFLGDSTSKFAGSKGSFSDACPATERRTDQRKE